MDLDIIEVLQEYIDERSAELFKSDVNCPPVFKVFNMSTMSGDNDKFIAITIEHLGSSIGFVFYPDSDAYYGEYPIDQVLVSLYNKTM